MFDGLEARIIELNFSIDKGHVPLIHKRAENDFQNYLKKFMHIKAYKNEM